MSNRGLAAAILTTALTFSSVACQLPKIGDDGRLVVKINDIRVNPDKYSNLAVTLRGRVESELLPQPGNVGTGYHLRDRYGDLMLVVTTGPTPDIGSEFLVTGFVTKRESDIYFAEANREAVGPQWRSILLIALGGALLLLVALIAWSFRPARPEYTDPVQSDGYGTGDAAAPIQGERAKTVKIQPTGKAVDIRTGRLLPGKLTLLSGDGAPREFTLVDRDGRGEVEIGRVEAGLTSGVRVNDPSATLSRYQARILYSAPDNRFRLLNLVGQDRNPTSFRGRPMGENETVELEDGALLTMGALEFRFTKNSR